MVARYVYDAWGNHQVINNGQSNIGTINPIRYRGYYYDTETGLYYLYSRYYDPEIGRFISPDSINYLDPESIGGLNLYTYCFNNPVMVYDPSGHFVIPLIIGALIGLIVELAVDYFEDDSRTINHSLLEYVGAGVGGGISGGFGSSKRVL